MVCTTWSDQAVLVDGSNLLPQLSQLAQALRGGVLMLNTLEFGNLMMMMMMMKHT
jgi:hypothetical protein